MPGGDRTGPLGRGPMTGRGAGYCGGGGVPGGPRGDRAGRGRRGHRHTFHATGLTGKPRAGRGVPDVSAATQPPPELSPEDELRMLAAQADAAATTLDHIRQRIDEIAAKTETPATGQQ